VTNLSLPAGLAAGADGGPEQEVVVFTRQLADQVVRLVTRRLAAAAAKQPQNESAAAMPTSRTLMLRCGLGLSPGLNRNTAEAVRKALQQPMFAASLAQYATRLIMAA
jgi:hypothetical protein